MIPSMSRITVLHPHILARLCATLVILYRRDDDSAVELYTAVLRCYGIKLKSYSNNSVEIFYINKKLQFHYFNSKGIITKAIEYFARTEHYFGKGVFVP